MAIERNFLPQAPPSVAQPDAQALARWGQTQFDLLTKSLSNFVYLQQDVLHVEPAKPRDGMTVFADGVDWNPGSGGGFYIRFNDSWVRLVGATEVATAAAPSFSVHKNGISQTGVASGVYTLVTWNTIVYDVGSHFASNAWTPPAGRVFLTSQVYTYSASGTAVDGGIFAVAIFKNGVNFRQGLSASANASGAPAAITVEDVASGTDVYTVQSYCTLASGTGTVEASPQNSWFMGHWISA